MLYGKTHAPATGTPNQIIVSPSQVLSLPQNIHTGAEPVFAKLSLSNLSITGDAPNRKPIVWNPNNGLLEYANYNTIAAQIDHNALLNYSPNRHIDHSAVSIIAGTGLTGGGDITASRTLSVDPSGIDHNSLAGLTTGDPHTQYALLAGRSGGQTLIGGIAASQNLTLQSTSHTTRGQIIASDTLRINLNGSVTAPSLRLNSTNTGFYSPGTNQAALSVAGVRAIQVNPQFSSNGPFIGLVNTTPSTSAYLFSDVTSTALDLSTWLKVNLAYNATASFNLFAAVLDFTISNSVDMENRVVVSNAIVNRDNTVSDNAAFHANPRISSTAKINTGTRDYIGFSFRPDPLNSSANLTGGTLRMMGVKISARPNNYAGSGLDFQYYGYYSLEGMIVHNDNGGDYDARFEGDNDPNLLFLDASADTVQIGSDTTVNGAKFYVHGLSAVRLGSSTSAARAGGVIADNFSTVSVGGTEADIYSYTIPANTFSANGVKIIASYGGNFSSDGMRTTQLKVYLAGNNIWNSGSGVPPSGTSSWSVKVELIRSATDAVRYTVCLMVSGGAGFVPVAVGELTGLTFSGTNILKITGASAGFGAGTGDVVGRMAIVTYLPQA